MVNLIISQFSKTTSRYTNPDSVPNVRNVPVGSTEKQVKDEVDRLNQSIEEIKKFKEEIVKESSDNKSGDSDVAQ